MTSDELNLYMAQQVDKTVQIDLARGNVPAATTDIAKLGAYVAQIADPGTRAQGQAIADADQAALDALDPQSVADRRAAASTADANVELGVAKANLASTLDPMGAGGGTEVQDIRAAQDAKAKGLDPSTAYTFGPAVAAAEGDLKKAVPMIENVIPSATTLKVGVVVLVAILVLILAIKVT